MLAKALPTLFKLSSTGKVSQWTIVVHPEYRGDGYYYEVTHGYTDGKMQSTSTRVAEGKNLGRANQTNAYEQAVSEATSKWNKQKDKGYVEDINTLVAAKTYLPMLAKSFDKDGKKIVFPCYCQPKLDGIRCISYLKDGKVVMLTRKGKPFNSIPHIEAALWPLFQKHPDRVLDGELYSDTLGFQKITSIVRKTKSVDDDAKKIEYHIYDHIASASFIKRHMQLETMLAGVSKPLVMVKTIKVHRDDMVPSLLQVSEDAGYEGIMLRNGGGIYETDKRSFNLQKVKSFKDAEFEIVGGESGVGKFTGFCTFICKTDDGKEFRCMPMGTEQERRDYLTNIDECVGKMLTVKYFEMTDDGLPRFPVGVVIRDYEG